MIPDFPSEKEKISKYIDIYINLKHNQYLGFFGNIPGYRNYEGNQWEIIRADGSEKTSEYNEYSGLFHISLEEVPDFSVEKLVKLLDSVAREMAEQMHKSIFASLNQSIKETGNAINGKGQPFTKELYLKTIDKLKIDFNEKGEPSGLALIVHPNFWEANKERLSQWEKDEKFNKDYINLMKKKREEWVERENNRKLVD